MKSQSKYRTKVVTVRDRSYSLNNRREKGTHESNTHIYTIIIN